MPTASVVDIGDQILRYAWVFQAFVAFWPFIFLGFSAWASLTYQYYAEVYRFIAYGFNSLGAGSILFISLVQRKIGTANRNFNFGAELIKSSIATIMWLWLLLDSIFYPSLDPPSWAPPEYWEKFRVQRIIRAALSVLFLPILFYSTFGYAWYAKRYLHSETRLQRSAHGESPTEASPLLESR